jgi:hypothetical protein
MRKVHWMFGARFIDARYQRIETSEPTEFIPVTVGFASNRLRASK